MAEEDVELANNTNQELANNLTKATSQETEDFPQDPPHLDENRNVSSSQVSRTTTSYTPSVALQTQKHYRIDPEKWCGLFRGYVRQDWDTINIPDGVDELRAHWVELFFDLIYVACIIHISTEAAYSISSNTSSTIPHRRLAGAGLNPEEHEQHCNVRYPWTYSFIVVTFAQFGLLCNAWMDQVMYTTHFVFNQMGDDFVRLLFMLCVLAMGIFIKDMEAYHRAFLISFMVLKAVEILMFIKVALIPRGRQHAVWNISMFSIEILIALIVLAVVDGGCSMDYFWVYLFLYLFGSMKNYLGFWVSKWCGHDKKNLIGIPLNVPHISERVGLFVMIILGESIISIMTSDLGELDLEERFRFKADGSPPSQILVVFVLLAFVLSYSVARLYFDCQPSEESILEGYEVHALRVSAFRGITYMKSHEILFFGLLGLGMGIKITGKHLLADNKSAIDVVLPGYSLVVIIITLNAIRIAHPYRVHIKFWIMRGLLLVVMIVLPIFWEKMNNGVIFLVIMLCVELQLWLDVEGREKIKNQKGELKEKREHAEKENDEKIRQTVRFKHMGMKRMASSVGKL
eukprot:271703_1